MNRQAPIQDMKNSEQKKMHWFLKIIIESVTVFFKLVVAKIMQRPSNSFVLSSQDSV